MSNKQCPIFAELLVDFADGELHATQHSEVAGHLATCPDCRAELRLLERSLDLAREVWQQAALPLDKKTAPPSLAPSRVPKLPLATRFRPSGRGALAACVAACVFLLLLMSTAWWLLRLRSDGQLSGAIAGRQASPPQASSDDEIDRFISRQTRSARLAVAVQLLASQPGLEGYKAQAERYLAEISDATGPGP